MTRAGTIIMNLLKLLASVAVGGMLVFVGINMTAGPGTIVTSQDEAEGLQFSDPATIDIVTTFKRNRVCPAVTQRWVWRWITYEGERIPEVYPVASTVTPFLAEGGKVMLSFPNPAIGVFDSNDEWFYRTVTSEQCGFLPQWAGMMLGARIYRSPDRPVNFVGAVHEHKAKEP